MVPEFIIENIKISDLRLDARYQRDINDAVVEKIVGNFRRELFPPIIVGMRNDGALHIVDGQHRVASARRLGWAEVPCQIFESRGAEHEAEVFEMLQVERRPLSVAERWKARLTRGEPIAVAVTEIVKGCGLELTGRSVPTGIKSFTACEKAYNRGNLRETLTLLIQAWDYDQTGFRGVFVNGLSVTLGALAAKSYLVDIGRLADALSKVSPSKFLRDVALSRTPNATFLRVVVDQYNVGLRGPKRLDAPDPIALIDNFRSQLIQKNTTAEDRAKRIAKANAGRTAESNARAGRNAAETKRRRREAAAI